MKEYAPAMECMHLFAEIARESFIMLDTQFRVLSVNQAFCWNFLVAPEHAEQTLLYRLGNGQWNIPQLKLLLEELLPTKHVVVDYELTHVFKALGKRTLLINAMHLAATDAIILAIDDVTVQKEMEKKIAECEQLHQTKTTKLVAELVGRVKELESLNQTMVGRELKMLELKKEIARLKKLLPRTAR